MTARQLEFCRLFATGMSATKAAIAAGYARSTASQNCAAMLNSPTIKARLVQLEKKAYTSHQDILHFKNILNDIVSREQSNAIVIRAIMALIKLSSIPLPHFIANNIEQHQNPTNNPTMHPINNPTNPDNPTTQPTEIQQDKVEEEIIEETDPQPTISGKSNLYPQPGKAFNFTLVDAEAPHVLPTTEADYQKMKETEKFLA
jgi:hypothetical protein